MTTVITLPKGGTVSGSITEYIEGQDVVFINNTTSYIEIDNKVVGIGQQFRKKL